MAILGTPQGMLHQFSSCIPMHPHTHSLTNREFLWLKSFLTRSSLVFISAVMLLSVRLYLNGGDPPHFVESDNPASFSPHFSTRFLTYIHLTVLNLWLLLCPSRLCFDWSMNSIPLVESVNDVRNLWSVLVAVVMLAFLLFTGRHFSKLVRVVTTLPLQVFHPFVVELLAKVIKGNQRRQHLRTVVTLKMGLN